MRESENYVLQIKDLLVRRRESNPFHPQSQVAGRAHQRRCRRLAHCGPAWRYNRRTGEEPGMESRCQNSRSCLRLRS